MALGTPGTVLALLVAATSVASIGRAAELGHLVTEGARGLAQAEEKTNGTLQSPDSELRKKIREENDKKSAAREVLYPRQALSLAKHYKETAAVVSRQGGNPQPLLDAAAYFENQSR